MSSPKVPDPVPPPTPPPAPTKVAQKLATKRTPKGASKKTGTSSLTIRRPSVNTGSQGTGSNLPY